MTAASNFYDHRARCRTCSAEHITKPERLCPVGHDLWLAAQIEQDARAIQAGERTRTRGAEGTADGA